MAGHLIYKLVLLLAAMVLARCGDIELDAFVISDTAS